MINFILVEEGYAKILSIEPNTKYKSEISTLQKKAKEEKLGLWGRC